MQWKNVYLIISSFYDDMHAERGYLEKKVFPQLSDWCEKRKLRLVYFYPHRGALHVDIMHDSLDYIDDFNPFFLCFMGQRLGWMPNESCMNNIHFDSLPRLLERCIHGGEFNHIDYEMLYTLLSPKKRLIGDNGTLPSQEHTLFFFREDRFTYKLTPSQRRIYANETITEDIGLEAFKKQILDSGADVTVYAGRWDETAITKELLTTDSEAAQGKLVDFNVNSQPLEDVVLDKLKTEIERAFPNNIWWSWEDFKGEIVSMDEQKGNDDIAIVLELLYLKHPEWKDIVHKLGNYSNYDIEGAIKANVTRKLRELSFQISLRYIKENAYYSLVREAASEEIPIREEEDRQEEIRQANLRSEEDDWRQKVNEEKEKITAFKNQFAASGLYDEADIQNDFPDIAKMVTMRMPASNASAYDMASDRAEEHVRRTMRGLKLIESLRYVKENALDPYVQNYAGSIFEERLKL